ncbi:hypothetical protein HMPREF9628_01136 [Peptoanaerobacter stomatis]|uniref:DNA methylase N-4/N-6 domain-containing protein n=1 Tax=Peptoanaerobacter stomatis TaxID=796937 RepID=G9XAW9_9FIRM|nr:site-specific DNA-methyltransferase [Peptoanaerobacter stomatis]EHL19963.1 hypothetical protein HMPREF9628_01136 [Peptoanaerobacter stomatis]
MNKNIFEIVEEVLKTNSKYISDDGKLLKAIVYSDVMTMDKELLHLLLSNEKIKERFFKDVNGTLIFDKQGFAWFIESKEFLPDSYTRYTNKIGLTNGGDFISKSNDVVLDFPYKDCVLEGGQDKEDQKRKEIFYNETIASDEISKMLAPKVFTNAKRYTKDGVKDNVTFDENDNLIIKGNNLIALSSLLKRYEGKVKCIYIDPPYNTGSDSFNYNDAFNHSTWLTFMKNRLEIAKRLLKEDGVIFVQCDDKEQPYLQVMTNEIFGRENRVNTIIWKKLLSAKKQSSYLSNVTEYILVYKKSNQAQINKVFLKVEEIKDLKNYPYIEDTTQRRYGSFDFTQKGQGPSRRFNGIELEPPKGKHWIWDQNKINEGIKNNIIIFTKNGMPRVKRYLDEKEGNPLSDLWSDDEVKIISANDKERYAFDGQKPENLIKRILDISTDFGDLVLDFHIGTGTTCAVAHKMGRRYIGVEQMDYIQNITVERMKKVIDGEQGGISKSADWQGGGSFIYCELLENASTLIEKIQAASEETISKIKKEIYVDERIIPYITREELEKADEEFNSLKLEEKKKALISLVDKNKLYVNYSDMDDESYAISESDKAFTKSFYAEV